MGRGAVPTARRALGGARAAASAAVIAATRWRRAASGSRARAVFVVRRRGEEADLLTHERGAGVGTLRVGGKDAGSSGGRGGRGFARAADGCPPRSAG